MKNKLTKYVIRILAGILGILTIVLIPVYLLEGKECDESFVYSG